LEIAFLCRPKSNGDESRFVPWATLDEAEKLARKLELNLIGALEKPFLLEDVKDVLLEHVPPKCEAVWRSGHVPRY
jgi:hypothetical protein